MSQLISKTKTTIASKSPVIGFPKGKYRHLTIGGETCFALDVCDTCMFLFKHQASQPSLAIDGISNALSQGLTTLDDEVISPLKSLFPSGNYIISLLEITPKAAILGTEEDYFFKLTGQRTAPPPEQSNINYYHTVLEKQHDDTGRYEFFLPLYSYEYLNSETIQGYNQRLAAGSKPTAIAFSTIHLWRVQHQGKPKFSSLIHFIVDGHHKLEAAARTSESITLLSFLAVDELLSCQPSEVDDILNQFL